MFPRIEEMFDLGPLRRSEKWGTIQAAFNEYFADRYRDNKSAFKATHFLNRGGYDAVDEIRRNPPPNMELSMWEKYIEHYMDEKHVKRAAINKENRKKNKVHSRHGSRSLAASRHQYFETSETQEYPSLIQSYYGQRCKNGEWMQDEARVNYEEMCRLRDLGADNPLGRPYTEVEILAIVLKGKQRGKVAGVGRVLSEKMILPPVSPRSSSYDKEKIDEMMAAKDKKIADLQKKTEEQAKESKAVQRQVSEFFKVVQTHPPDRWSELMSQIASTSDVGSGSGAGGSVDLDEEGSDHDDDDE